MYYKPLYVKKVNYTDALCNYKAFLENIITFVDRVKVIFEQRGFVAKGLQAKVEVCKKQINFFGDGCCDDKCSSGSSSSDSSSSGGSRRSSVSSNTSDDSYYTSSDGSYTSSDDSIEPPPVPDDTILTNIKVVFERAGIVPRIEVCYEEIIFMFEPCPRYCCCTCCSTKKYRYSRRMYRTTCDRRSRRR